MQNALLDIAREVEEHVAREGWDQPLRLFAIVLTSDVLATNPELQLSSEQVYTSVEQEIADPSIALDDLLGTIAWPEEVHGAIVVMERIVIDAPNSDEAEQDQPDIDELLNHPSRHDVRMLSAVLRSQQTMNALRYRQYDTLEDVAFAPDLVPSLNEALLSTFE